MKNSREDMLIVGICLIVSAGAFLYAATIHILPEVYCSSETHRPHKHMHYHEDHVHDTSHHSKLVELLCIISGISLPFLFTFIPLPHPH